MSRKKLPWLRLRSKTAPDVPYEPPIFLGDKSNGEFYQPQTRQERKIRDEILRQCDDKARKVGLERREFIASAMGMCTSLSVLNLAAGCGDKNGQMPMNMAEGMMEGNARMSPPPSMLQPTGGNGTPMAVGPMGGPGPQAGPMPGPGGMMPGPGGMMPGPGGMMPGPGGMMPGPGGMMPGPDEPMAEAPPADSGCADWCEPAGKPDGGFCIPQEATLDCDVARELIGGDEFIMDLQTHHVNDGRPGFVLSPCQINGMAGHDGDMQVRGNQCAWPDNYLEQIFLDSDTTVAVLSGLPSRVSASTGDLTGFSNADMAASRDAINMAAASQRMVNHCQVGPDSNWPVVADMMERVHNELGHVGWKCYPPASTGGGPWWLDGEVGERFINKALELGDPLICAHKGFPLPGFSAEYANPKDVGPAALKFPDAVFIIYHSAYNTGTPEGPYDPSGGGVDRLIKTVEENDLKGKNVYAEMGSAWLLASGNPMTAQHYVGKVLKHLGHDRMLWGSECVWFGSPQRQIEAFRTFTISKELQEMHGYPELTPAIKAGIFGLNAARLYCVDPNECRYQVDKSMLARRKRNVDGEFGDRRWAFEQPAIKTRRQFINLRRERIAHGELG
ncbi:MAG: amidohydrolase family protein [Myxococcales bacterium]|nr:amidohydrolase family protein [Myxococcales bacterium]MDD9970315.1 amidohydrolase family protein [Myxococcales bacterium]